MIPQSRTITHTLAGASLACALLLVALYGMQTPLRHTAQVAVAASPTLALDASNILGKSAIVYDPATKHILFSKEADLRLPLASLTKLMSAETVLAHNKGVGSVVITLASLKPEGDWGFKAGEEWSLADLVRFGLVASSNDAMAAAGETLEGDIVDRMNRHARELGLTQTYFYNPTGLDLDIETAGAYGSAHDVAVLAAAFLAQYPAEFEATAAPTVSISNSTHTLTANSTAAPLLDIPGLIAAKTGYTDLAGGNLVAAVDMGVGHPIIVAVLGSTVDGRFADVKTLIEMTRLLFISQ